MTAACQWHPVQPRKCRAPTRKKQCLCGTPSERDSRVQPRFRPVRSVNTRVNCRGSGPDRREIAATFRSSRWPPTSTPFRPLESPASGCRTTGLRSPPRPRGRRHRCLGDRQSQVPDAAPPAAAIDADREAAALPALRTGFRIRPDLRADTPFVDTRRVSPDRGASAGPPASQRSAGHFRPRLLWYLTSSHFRPICFNGGSSHLTELRRSSSTKANRS